MTAQDITAHDVVTFGDVKLLAGAHRPCITVVANIPTPFELAIRLKKAAQTVAKKLKDERAEFPTVESLCQPIEELEHNVKAAGIWSNALIAFRSPDVFRYFLLHRRLPEAETVEERFQVRPLCSVLAREQQFHLLCLSRGNIRLLRCTQHRTEEEKLGEAPGNMDEWLNMRQPDHVLENRATGGPSLGSMKGVTFGTSTDREREDKYLAHFFKAVDRGMNSLLRGGTAPLLLAGIVDDVAIYRRVSTYPRLLERAVYGSPDGSPDQELHSRAMRVMMQSHSESLEKALAEFERHRDDTSRCLSDAHQVIKAAWEGRVADLFFSEGAEIRGLWNEETFDLDTRNPREDLLNAAALQTLLHGGRAFELDSTEMPAAREVVAVLRF